MSRNYTYSDRHKMRTIREAGWFIQNWYDETSRCIKQTTLADDSDMPATLDAAYSKVEEGGMQVDVAHYDGTLASYLFDGKRQSLSVTYDADTNAPFAVTYQREPVTGIPSEVTLTCGGPTRKMTHTLPTSLVPAELDRPLLRRRCALCDLCG